VWSAPAAASLDTLTSRDPRLAERLHTAIGEYALTGRGDVRPLRGRPEFRLRIGGWRVLFTVDTVRREITLRALADRKDAYRG
jgi:mRNA interferase RelE/StbE